MTKKYYGVKSPELKIFDNWKDCESYVKGRKGAIFKSFSTKEECIDFVYDNRAELNPQKAFVAEYFDVKNKTLVSRPKFKQSKPLEVHVDGSFNKETKTFGSGLVFVQEGVRVYEQFLSGSDTSNEWQISGEVHAALSAIKTAIRSGFKEVTIWHDLIHLTAWALDFYSTKNSLLGEYYVKNLKELEKVIAIKFVKVEAHSQEPFNERADYLAKLACGLR